jgi:hypothetical protein
MWARVAGRGDHYTGVAELCDSAPVTEPTRAKEKLSSCLCGLTPRWIRSAPDVFLFEDDVKAH